MSELFKKKYRIQSSRLPYWDYANTCWYFVTICTKNREHFFGEIKNEIMGFSGIGVIVTSEWQKTEQIRDNVKLDEWIVMPNHLHGIVVIENADCANGSVETHCNASLPQRNKCPQPKQPTEYHNKFGPQSNNLSAIIRGFKGTTTKQIHQSGFPDFAWQPRFYDCIIRNENELNRVREYIRFNPIKWESDRNNPENIFL